MPRKRSLEQRLLEGSEVADNGCRRWTGCHSGKGYGQINVGGTSRIVHRIAYEVWCGPIPDGMDIDHVRANGCLYRDCIEPSHLEAVTHHENILRKPQPTHCPQGHEYTPENTKHCKRNDSPSIRRTCRTCHNARQRARRARKAANQPERKGNS